MRKFLIALLLLSFVRPVCADVVSGANTLNLTLGSLTASAASIDVGSTTQPFRFLYLYGAGTYATTYLKFTGTPTSTRTITFPDASDTVATLGQAETITGIKTFSAAPIATTGIDIGSTAAPFRNLYLFGAGTFATTYLKLTGTPTGTRTVTFPDATDTVAELGQANAFTGANTFAAVTQLNNSVQGSELTKALVAANATIFATVTVATSSRISGVIQYSVEADDTVDFQVRGGTIPFTAVNKAGTTTCTVGTVTTATEVVAVSSGTLTNTMTCADAGSGVLNLLANAASSLTETTLQVRARVTLIGTATVAHP